MIRVTDWRGRKYDVEIARVSFLGGFIAWIDDEPYLEGEPFRTRHQAEREVRAHLEYDPK